MVYQGRINTVAWDDIWNQYSAPSLRGVAIGQNLVVNKLQGESISQKEDRGFSGLRARLSGDVGVVAIEVLCPPFRCTVVVDAPFEAVRTGHSGSSSGKMTEEDTATKIALAGIGFEICLLVDDAERGEKGDRERERERERNL